VDEHLLRAFSSQFVTILIGAGFQRDTLFGLSGISRQKRSVRLKRGGVAGARLHLVGSGVTFRINARHEAYVVFRSRKSGYKRRKDVRGTACC